LFMCETHYEDYFRQDLKQSATVNQSYTPPGKLYGVYSPFDNIIMDQQARKFPVRY